MVTTFALEVVVKTQTKQPFLKLPRSPRFAATTEVASYGFPKETCRVLATEQSQRKNTMRGICFILFWGYHPAREQTATFSLCFAQTPNASLASSHSSDTKLLETKKPVKKMYNKICCGSRDPRSHQTNLPLMNTACRNQISTASKNLSP